MTTRMLIDARHQEETRVAVVKGNKIEEFDFESADHKQIKGNIYLAKVTRVEPSLQAAFVEYGGNRHGFLAFSEIHPDYYQIPREDREKLLAEEAEHAAEEAALREQEEEEDDVPGALMRSDMVGEEDSDFIEVDKDESVDTIDMQEGQEPDLDDDADDDNGDDNGDSDEGDSEGNTNGNRGGPRRRGRGPRNTAKASDAARQKRMALRRRYKIQDVIQRRQVVLVQVVKEERGNKGAALTTYLSLAGRYCVLMPNTSHGGGISRKISSATDRKRLKSIIADLSLPASMGCIVRTAGLSRTKPEIKRDFDYLARLWDEIRENTLKATAPQLIHSDSDLIKRAIRDIYNRDITDVLVEGADGFRAAKDFMKLLMPSHARRVQSYSDPVSLFQRYGVEDQLSAMYQPEVQLPSGGYLVINPTEALVSIDINSGRSTKEHGIEATALKTNMEAANEIARQLRLRDMAGLVVIDFIDMDRHGNVRKVERALKEALKNDRARIQVGRISSFGLLEMSRQRLRTGVLEASTRVCPHCEGTGLVRTASSAGLSALRLIEEEAAKGKFSQITLRASQEAVIFVLNTKRTEISEIEARYGVTVEILPDGESEGAKMTVTGAGPPPQNAPVFVPIIDDDDSDIPEEIDDEKEEVEQEERPRKKRRRRGGRRNRNGRRDEEGNGEETEAGEASDAPEGAEIADTDEQVVVAETDAVESDKTPAKPRRRRGRGGKAGATAVADAETQDAIAPVDDAAPAAEAEIAVPEEDSAPPAKPKRAPRKRAAKKPEATAETAEESVAEAEVPVPDAPPKAPAKKPAARKAAAKKSDTVTEQTAAEPEGETVEESASPAGPARKGWWQRTFG